MSLVLSVALLATIPLRNPFWPVGYTGEREPIVNEPRVRVAAAASEETAEEDTKTGATDDEAIAEAEAQEQENGQGFDRLWIKARKQLKIGSTLKLDGNNTRQAITINDKIYADGDLVSFNYNGYRFTWKIKQLTDNNTLRLQRIKARELKAEPEEKGLRK